MRDRHNTNGASIKPRKTIQNCQVEVKFDCPKNWDELELTESENIRFCSSCNKNVYFCNSYDKAIEHANLGNCIALEIPSEDQSSEVFLGEIESYPIKIL